MVIICPFDPMNLQVKTIMFNDIKNSYESLSIYGIYTVDSL